MELLQCSSQFMVYYFTINGFCLLHRNQEFTKSFRKTWSRCNEMSSKALRYRSLAARMDHLCFQTEVLSMEIDSYKQVQILSLNLRQFFRQEILGQVYFDQHQIGISEQTHALSFLRHLRQFDALLLFIIYKSPLHKQ